MCHFQFVVSFHKNHKNIFHLHSFNVIIEHIWRYTACFEADLCFTGKLVMTMNHIVMFVIFFWPANLG